MNYLLSTFTDPDRKRSTDGLAIPALDGLRAIAAMAVVASHSGVPGLYGQGGLGVLMFFVLSGYVLTLPFVADPGRIGSWRTLGKYAVNRFLRVYPAYAASVFFYAWYIGFTDPQWTRDHLTMAIGWGHLWSVVQEMRFYAFLPLVLMCLALVPARFRLAILLCIAVLAWSLQNMHTIYMSPGLSMPFMFWSFLGGSVAAFAGQVGGLLGRACLWIGTLAVIAIGFTGDDTTSALGLPSLNGWNWPVTWASLFTLLLIGIASAPNSISVRVYSCWPLRHLGLLSYGIYLWHHAALVYFLQTGWQLGWQMFGAVSLASYVAATASYLLIEKPAMSLKRVVARPALGASRA